VDEFRLLVEPNREGKIPAGRPPDRDPFRGRSPNAHTGIEPALSLALADPWARQPDIPPPIAVKGNGLAPADEVRVPRPAAERRRPNSGSPSGTPCGGVASM
jgi:hypothetical protein